MPRQLRHRRSVGERIEPRTFAFDEPQLAAERVRDHQDIGKQDRGIEAKPPDRLQRHLCGPFRREAQLEEASRLLAQRAILRQIAPRLAHHPDRRHGLTLAVKHIEQRLMHGQFGHEALL